MLNKKLKVIADSINKNIRVIDVGCDHGLLDIYLTLYNNNECLATDINNNALENAKQNIKKYNLEEKITCILTPGIENIDIKKTDIVVIAGMGADTILKIIENKNIENLIVSSNNNEERLRKSLIKKYTIINDIVVYDKNKYYVILKLKKGKSKLSKKNLFLGNYKDSSNKNYYKFLLKKYYKIYNQVPYKKIITKIKLKKRIKYLKAVL